MKLDLQSLSAEPLIYMLMHSGAFVTALGIVFFLIGLLFGRATWGRYKRQTRELRREVADMKEEIADLKRKLGDLSVKHGPSVSIVTETISMPRREPAATDAASFPGLEERKAKKAAQAARSTAVFAPPAAQAPPPEPPPVRPMAPHVTKNKTLAPVSTSEPAEAHARVTSPEPPAAAAPAKPMEPSGSDNGAAEGVLQPVMTPTVSAAPEPEANGTAAPSARPASALAAIITHPHVPHDDLKSPAPVEIPTLPEIPLPAGAAQLPKAEVKPQMHPHLGLIYKARPAQVDDLTALKGVARPLEQRLHVLGVYTYEQIAGWTKDQVREFSARLSFKDRIEREHWVEQARRLLASKQ